MRRFVLQHHERASGVSGVGVDVDQLVGRVGAPA